MDIKTITSFLWKWTKRILYVFLGFFVIVILIAIFGPEEWKHPKTQNQTGFTLSGIVTNTENTTKISSGSSNTGSVVSSGSIEIPKSNTGTSNTGVLVATGTNIPETSKTTLDEATRKEFYFEYKKVEESMNDVYRTGAPKEYTTDQARGKYYGSIQQARVDVLLKKYKITEDDIDPITAEAMKKGWNTEYYNSTEPSKQSTISQKAEVQKYVDSHQGDIWIACKKEIKDHLKSPSTADFPMLDFTIWAGNGDIVLKSYVDSQNGFGATIRTTFKCYFDYNNGNPSIKNVETF